MIRYICIFILFPMMLFAADQDKVTIYLTYQSNVGVKIQKSVHVESKRILVNSRAIDSTLWPKILPTLQKIGRIQKVTDKNCAAGTYTLTVTRRNSAAQKEMGCLNSNRLTFLKSQFDKLELESQLD